MSSPFLEVKERIFENSIGFVIYDKFAVSKGHCLIIPKREYPDYFDSTDEEIIGLSKALAILAQKVSGAIYTIEPVLD